MSFHIFIGPSYDFVHIKQTYFKHVNRNSTVLEIGASTVNQTADLAFPVKKLIGVEYFSSRIPHNFANIEYIQGDWQKLSEFIAPNSIDCVISTHTIEHVLNDLVAINELYKVLKPKGVAILNTPNRQRLTRRIIELFTGPRKFPYWEHIREYSYNDLIAVLKKSKFKDFQIYPILFGVNSGRNIQLYSTTVPKLFFNYANYWEIILSKS